jgi:hypothetical protein
MKQAGKSKRVSSPRLPKLKVRPLAFFYEKFGNHIRWWRNDHPGDVFDIIDEQELAIRLKGAEFLSIPVFDHLPGFCDLRDECPDHLGYH